MFFDIWGNPRVPRVSTTKFAAAVVISREICREKKLFQNTESRCFGQNPHLKLGKSTLPSTGLVDSILQPSSRFDFHV